MAQLPPPLEQAASSPADRQDRGHGPRAEPAAPPGHLAPGRANAAGPLIRALPTGGRVPAAPPKEPRRSAPVVDNHSLARVGERRDPPAAAPAGQAGGPATNRTSPELALALERDRACQAAGCSHYRGLCTLQFPQYRNACAERLRQVRAAWLLWLQDGAHVCPAQRW